MIDSTKTLDTIALALGDVRSAAPVSAIGRSQMHEALMHLYMARDAVEAALRADGQPVTYPVTRSDGSVVRVSVPEDK
ncbi:MAG: hypothetical protein WC563_15970 [Brevundimonas sp.]